MSSGYAGTRGGDHSLKVNFGSALAVLAESQPYLAALELLLSSSGSDHVVSRVTELICQKIEGDGFWPELGAALTSLPLSPDASFTSMECGGIERYTNCAGAPCYRLRFGEGRNVTCVLRRCTRGATDEAP